jgi:hypothetical protein
MAQKTLFYFRIGKKRIRPQSEKNNKIIFFLTYFDFAFIAPLREDILSEPIDNFRLNSFYFSFTKTASIES